MCPGSNVFCPLPIGLKVLFHRGENLVGLWNFSIAVVAPQVCTTERISLVPCGAHTPSPWCSVDVSGKEPAGRFPLSQRVLGILYSHAGSH